MDKAFATSAAGQDGNTKHCANRKISSDRTIREYARDIWHITAS
ncbi:MAG: hypothetical protein ACLUKN_03690 [Bacilli bacterium]